MGPESAGIAQHHGSTDSHGFQRAAAFREYQIVLLQLFLRVCHDVAGARADHVHRDAQSLAGRANDFHMRAGRCVMAEHQRASRALGSGGRGWNLVMSTAFRITRVCDDGISQS
jgi:hypothetical protein